MIITSASQVPEAQHYVLGWDLSLSGWGEFAYPETPERMTGMDYTELSASHIRQRCPVLYTVQPGEDMDLLLFNLRHCDVRVHEILSDIGRPRTEPTPDELEKIKAEGRRWAKDPSFVPGLIFAMGAFKKYDPAGVYCVFEWLMERNQIPFVILRTFEECSRWYTQPGLDWVFYDEEDVAYKFCHPRDRPRKGDYALQDGRVTLQRYAYRGVRHRPKVILVEESVSC